MTNRVIAFRCFVDWDHDGDFGESFEDISAYLVSARGDMRFSPPESSITGGRGIVSSMSLTLRNADGRFSPLRTDGPLYSYLANGGMYHAPCYLEVSIDGGVTFERVFTGVLKLPSLNTLTTKQAPTLTLDARSMEERLLQWRTNTAQADFAAYHDGAYTEADIIEAWLDDAGVTAGEMEIEPGLFIIPWAWLNDESPIEGIWSLAAACGGRYYCDPDGVHRYENMAHWQLSERALAVQRRYTKDDFRMLAATYDDRDLYNTVTVETAPKMLSAPQEIWAAEEQTAVPAGATVTLIADFNAAAYQIDELTFAARSTGGVNLTASIAITPTYRAQGASLEIANSAAVLAYVDPIQIRGRALDAGTAQKETANSADNAAFFTARSINRTRRVRGNVYIQSPSQAATLARYIADRHEYPRVMWRLTDCVGYPGLRLGDRIEIADNDWHEKDGAAGVGVSLITDTDRTIATDETIVDVAIIVSSTVTVAGTWIIVSSDVGAITEISSPLTIPVGTTRTDTSGQEKIDGAVLVEPGVEVTVVGHWLLRAEGVYALLLGIVWQLDGNGFRQSLDAVATNNLFRHDGQYFVLNQAGHTLNGAKKVFY